MRELLVALSELEIALLSGRLPQARLTSKGKYVSTLQRIWLATRDNLVDFGHASRPARPGASPKLDAEARQRTQLAHLDRNGPKQMSAEGYSQAKTLLELAQSRPAGSAKRKKKELREAARTEKSDSASLNKTSVPSNE